jgi:ankyrin repeat protein
MDYDLDDPHYVTGNQRLRRLAFDLTLGIALLGLSSATFAGELHEAVRAKDKGAVKSLLIGGVEVDETDFVLGTALHLAVSQADTEIASTLIDNGADVEAVSEQQGSRALHLAAQFGNAPMLALLLDSGTDIEARDDYQRTPLTRAAAAGHVEAVQLLLDRGAKVDAREGKFGGTPLHEAAHQGRLAVVKLLVEHGAGVNATNNTGRTPFWEAAFPQSYTVVGDASLLEYLLVQGADPNVEDTSGMSVLAYVELQVRQGAVIFVQIADELRHLGIME